MGMCGSGSHLYLREIYLIYYYPDLTASKTKKVNEMLARQCVQERSIST